jgi:hypothetical protein
VYAWGYWLILAGSLSYLYVRRRNAYRSLRNALIISGLVGCFIFASFPVAPPRLTTMGFVDTVQLSGSLLEEVARPGALTNQNAAMPSAPLRRGRSRDERRNTLGKRYSRSS